MAADSAESISVSKTRPSDGLTVASQFRLHLLAKKYVYYNDHARIQKLLQHEACVACRTSKAVGIVKHVVSPLQ